MFAITGVGILVVSPEWLNALWIVAAVVGLLSGIASIAVVEVMSSSLATSEKAALSVVQSTGGAVLTLVITIVLGLFFLDPNGRDAHIALLWIGITAMLVASLSLLRIRPTGSGPAIEQHSIGILDALRSRPDRKHPWVREFLITQVLFLSIALGTSFYSVHGATLHGQKSDALHYIVAVTAVGSLLFTALWTLSRHKATIRGLLLTAAVLGVFAAVAALIADYSGAEALPILSGVVIVFAAAGGAATSSTRSTWMYHNLGHENDIEIIIFCQIVLGVTATLVGLGLSLLARLDTVAPAWVMLILSGYALFHARRGPRSASWTRAPAMNTATMDAISVGSTGDRARPTAQTEAFHGRVSSVRLGLGIHRLDLVQHTLERAGTDRDRSLVRQVHVRRREHDESDEQRQHARPRRGAVVCSSR